MEPEPPTTTGPPRWVKAFLVVLAVLVLLFVALRLTGVGGDHGPGRHGPGGGSESDGRGPTPLHDPSGFDHR